jgi:hypothetical protein
MSKTIKHGKQEMKKMKKVRCNLCDWETDHDNVNGKTRHVDWHKYARVQKRNTTQGDVIWI